MMDLLDQTQQPESPALTADSEIHVSMTEKEFDERLSAVRQELSGLRRAMQLTRRDVVIPELKDLLAQARRSETAEEAGDLAMAVVMRLPELHAASSMLGMMPIQIRKLFKEWHTRHLNQLWQEIRDQASSAFAPAVEDRERREREFHASVGDTFHPGPGLQAMQERLAAIRRSTISGVVSFQRRFERLGIRLAGGVIPTIPEEGDYADES